MGKPYVKRPELTESRLNQMALIAAKVYKGDTPPKVQCAEDVLILVAEVRDLRKQLQQELSKQDSLTEADSLFSKIFGSSLRTEVKEQDEENKKTRWWKF